VPHVQVPDGIPGIRALFHLRPEAAAPITALTQLLLHGEHTLTRGERELIGARVSALNGCTFCRESHTAVAACLLADEGLVAAVVRDPEVAPISAKLKALLGIAGAVQRSGRDVLPEHIERARREGASDLEIHDTVLIAALFCLFNRYVDGLAAPAPIDSEAYRQRAQVVADQGYRASAGPPDEGAAPIPPHR
jgi:uncharacterized peroxidase-related enzyme